MLDKTRRIEESILKSTMIYIHNISCFYKQAVWYFLHMLHWNFVEQRIRAVNDICWDIIYSVICELSVMDSYKIHPSPELKKTYLWSGKNVVNSNNKSIHFINEDFIAIMGSLNVDAQT